MNRLSAHRIFYANLITGSASNSGSELQRAFAETPRENFVGPGPWQIVSSGGYIKTPSDDPALLYQDILVALTPGGPINNGQPSLHAVCLSALKIREGERILHIGAGTGYYSAILSRLTGPAGSIQAYELEPELAKKAERNLTSYRNVTVVARSGSQGPLAASDVIYVNAGATEPLDLWLDALLPGGRLLFPLTPAEGFGGMLLVTKHSFEKWSAYFLMRVIFISCVGARDEETAGKLTAAFKSNDLNAVKSLRRNGHPDETCWVSGRGWWLSTSEA